MTTIAWDGNIVASDTQGTNGSLVDAKSYKGFMPPNDMECLGFKISLIMFSGTTGDQRHIYKYLNDKGDVNCYEMHEELEFSCMLFSSSGQCIIFSKAEGKKIPWIYQQQPPWAVGSGRDFAITAMHLGKNAPEAIDIAKELDAYTGGETICYNYRND